MINLRFVSITSVLLAGALGSASAASATSLHGTVVAVNKRAGSVVIVDRRGHLRAVHLSRILAPGNTVRLSIRKLRNGTFAGSNVRIGRRLHDARFRGRVTYVDSRLNAFVVSARRSSILVHVGGRSDALPLTQAKIASAATTVVSSVALPAIGSEVLVGVTIDPRGTLVATAVRSEGLSHDENLGQADQPECEQEDQASSEDQGGSEDEGKEDEGQASNEGPGDEQSSEAEDEIEEEGVSDESCEGTAVVEIPGTAPGQA